MKNPADGILRIDFHILRHGDKVIWGVVVLLLLFSLLGVISTSTIRQVSSISSVFITFARDVLAGVLLMFLAYWLNYRLYRGLTWIVVVLTIGALVWAFFSGTVIEGQNAGRWVRIFGVSFQPSAFALIAMVMFTARYLEKYSRDPQRMLGWKHRVIDLWGPVLVMAALIIPHNLSTGLIFLFTFYVMLVIGRYPFKHIVVTVLAFILLAALVFGAYKMNRDLFEGSRVGTWMARIENYVSRSKSKEMSKEEREKYLQITAAQTAIALGGSLPAAGPGKSIQKYFLSQADSDFIFSILVEEYSVVGGAFILLLFAVFAVRVAVQALRVEDLFGLLVLCGLLCVIMCQAIVHTGVNVGMLPVTGQNLPFISSGGTSIIASCLMVGIMQKIIMNAREKTPLPPLPSSPSSDPRPQPEVSAPEAFPQEEENNTPEEDTPEEQKRQEKARQILENI